MIDSFGISISVSCEAVIYKRKDIIISIEQSCCYDSNTPRRFCGPDSPSRCSDRSRLTDGRTCDHSFREPDTFVETGIQDVIRSEDFKDNQGGKMNNKTPVFTQFLFVDTLVPRLFPFL